MEKHLEQQCSLNPEEYLLAPIHPPHPDSPLSIAAILRARVDPPESPWLLLRELPGSRVYLGAVCDADARIQEFVEIWVQNLDQRDLTFSNLQERLTNFVFDERWLGEFEAQRHDLPTSVIVTGFERLALTPMLILHPGQGARRGTLPVTRSKWQLCTDDARLDSFGLPPYSTSPFRYLHEPGATEPVFIATSGDAPANAHVKGLEALKEPGTREVFNPNGGMVRVTRLSPLEFEDCLKILEGGVWEGFGPGTPVKLWGIYSELQEWAGRPRGVPFLLHGIGAGPERLQEILFLKLALLLDAFKEVFRYTRAQQLPLLNLSPNSFKAQLPETGGHFPSLWALQCRLVKPGQAYPLKIKATEQRYFLRLGETEPSPFLPEGLGAHSFGIGSVRLRNVTPGTDGTVLEGTLIAEDYLRPDPQDLLWFKLPVGEERLEFYAHVYTSEAVGPKEARFRTVPTLLSDSVLNVLKRTMAFAKAPYEIWPLLSSPCDMHSLGIIALRVLLANSKTNLAVVVDDVQGLARQLGKDPLGQGQVNPALAEKLARDRNLNAMASPANLLDAGWSSEQAWAAVPQSLWLDTLVWILRLFPGAGSLSYCKGFGDVSPLALETVYEQPIEDLERLCCRLRSIVAPSLASNEEIAQVILEQLQKL